MSRPKRRQLKAVYMRWMKSLDSEAAVAYIAVFNGMAFIVTHAILSTLGQ